MLWPPARFITPIVEAAAPREIDPREHPPQLQGYLREFFEAVIRTRARDARLIRRSDAAELVALYDAMPTSDVFGNLETLNLSLESEDRSRNPPDTHESDEAWEHLALTRQYAEAAVSAPTYVELVSTYCGSLAELYACREVVEATIAVTCHDARRAYLREDEHALLVNLSQAGHESLIAAYAHVNSTVERLGLDERIRLNPFIAPGEDGTS